MSCLVLLKAFSRAIATWSSTNDRKRVDWLLLPASYVCWWVNLRFQALMTPTWAVIEQPSGNERWFCSLMGTIRALDKPTSPLLLRSDSPWVEGENQNKNGKERHSSTPPLSGRFFWRSIYLRFPCHN